MGDGHHPHRPKTSTSATSEFIIIYVIIDNVFYFRVPQLPTRVYFTSFNQQGPYNLQALRVHTWYQHKLVGIRAMFHIFAKRSRHSLVYISHSLWQPTSVSCVLYWNEPVFSFLKPKDMLNGLDLEGFTRSIKKKHAKRTQVVARYLFRNPIFTVCVDGCYVRACVRDRRPSRWAVATTKNILAGAS